MAWLKILVLCIMVSSTAMSNSRFQSKENVTEDSIGIRKKWFIGANAGITVGNPNNILVSPSISYRLPLVIQKLQLLAGMKLIFAHNKYSTQGIKYDSYPFGFSLYGQANVYKKVFIQCEREFLTTSEQLTNLDGLIVGLFEAIGSFGTSNNLFLGIGWHYKLGKKLYLVSSVHYNVGWLGRHTIYDRPWDIRAGIVF